MKTEKKPIVTEIYEALGEASMCWNPIPTGVFESSRAAEIGERLVKIVEKYASQPMSAEQYANTIIPNANANDAPYCTTGERWEDIKDAFLAGQKSPAMSAEQVEGFNPEKQANIISIANEMFSTAPTVKADGRKPYNEDGTCKKCGGNQCDSDSHK